MASSTAAGGGSGVLTVGVNVGVSVDMMGTCPAPLSPGLDGIVKEAGEPELSCFRGELLSVDII